MYFKISTTSQSAKEIIYTLTGATVKGETVVVLPEVAEGEEKSIKIKIENCGPTNIIAVTSDGEGNESEPNGETVKYDNKAPQIAELQRPNPQGKNDWYTSDIEITIEGTDLNGKTEAEVADPKEFLDGYIYTVLSETETVLIPETHVQDITKAIKTSQINNGEDGIYKIKAKTKDKAGNLSEEKTIIIKKDTQKPTVGAPAITNVTTNSFKVTVSAGDDTSKVAYFEYYLNGTLTETSNEGLWEPTNLLSNTTYSVTVKVYDNAGLWKESSTSTEKTNNVIRQKPRVTSSNGTWTEKRSSKYNLQFYKRRLGRCRNEYLVPKQFWRESRWGWWNLDIRK